MMRAAVFKAVGKPLAIETLPDPEPGASQVVIRVHRCGICGSDLHLTEGHGFQLPTGTVLGHEFAGEVVAVGKGVTRLKVGDRAAAMPISGCGSCLACVAGEPAKCTAMDFAFGGYAEYALMNALTSVKLPASLTAADGALAEPLAVALHGVAMAQVKPGSHVAIQGAGPIGLAALFWARRFGAKRIDVIEGAPRRAEIAMMMGADNVRPPSGPDAEGPSYGSDSGEGAEYVFECVGRPGVLMQAVAMARRDAKVISLGFCFAPDPIVPGGVGNKEITLLFPSLYTTREYEHGLDVLAAGAVEPRAMITDIIGFDRLPESFEGLRRNPTQCKVMIDPFG